MHLKHGWYWYLWIYWIRLCHTGTAFQTTYGYAPQMPYVWCTAGLHVLPRYMCVRSEVVSKEY